VTSLTELLTGRKEEKEEEENIGQRNLNLFWHNIKFEHNGLRRMQH
jgi:hypothetical protein